MLEKGSTVAVEQGKNQRIGSDLLSPLTSAAARTRTGLMSRRFALYAIAITMIALSYFFSTRPQRPFENQPLHSTIEAVEALSVLLMAFFIRSTKEERPYKFVFPALGFLSMGILNSFHAALGPGNRFVFLRAVANLTGGLGFALAWLPASLRRAIFRKWAFRSAGAISLVVGFCAFSFPVALPAMFGPAKFTSLAITINFLAGLLFLAGALRFISDFYKSDDPENFLFSLVGALFGLSGLTFQYSMIWSETWWFWHSLRLLAAVLLLSFFVHRHFQIEVSVKARNEELRELNRELQAFSYSVAHDLRAPLRSMEGFSRILLNEYRDRLDAQGRDFLTRINTSAHKMDWIINDLLRLSKIARQGLSIERVDLSRIVDEIASDLSGGEEPGRQVKFLIEKGLTAKADRGLIKIAFENLMGNAWKFTSAVPVAEIEFGKTENDGREVFFIRDNGIGFSMEYSERIFMPFQRLQRDQDFPGTGIGLSTVARIIKRLGGEIWAVAETGKGATFYFTLPT